MSLKCKIIRDENGKVDFVEGPDGSQSQLYTDALKETKDENSSDDSFAISKNKIDEEGSFEDISESLLKKED